MNTFSIVIIGLIILPFLLFFIRIFIICWQNYALARQLKILEQQQAENMSHISFANSALNTTVATLLNSTESISSNSALNTTVSGHLNATQPISSSGVLNTTVAPLLNGTQPILHIQNSTVHTPFGNSTWTPLNYNITNNSSIYGGDPWYYNTSGYWNYTIYCPTCYPSVVTVDPPVVTYSYAYSYIYYVLLLVLLIVAIISIKIGISRRKELERRAAAQRRRACQQSAAPYTSTNNDSNTNNNNDDMTPKDFDLPPAYDDVVQSYMMAKQTQEQQQTQESNVNEGATGGITANPSSNNMSTAVSTLTIESEISNSNHVSTVDLDQATTSISNTTSSQQPPSYDHSSEMSTAKSNDHIV